MPPIRETILAVLALVALEGCRVRRLPELPPAREPGSAAAPVSTYEAPPDVLTSELVEPVANDEADAHAGHSHHHGHAGHRGAP